MTAAELDAALETSPEPRTAPKAPAWVAEGRRPVRPMYRRRWTAAELDAALDVERQQAADPSPSIRFRCAMPKLSEVVWDVFNPNQREIGFRHVVPWKTRRWHESKR